MLSPLLLTAKDDELLGTVNRSNAINILAVLQAITVSLGDASANDAVGQPDRGVWSCLYGSPASPRLGPTVALPPIKLRLDGEEIHARARA